MPDRIDAIIMPRLSELTEKVKVLESKLDDITETLDSISKLAYKVNSLGFRIDKLEGLATTTSFVAKDIPEEDKGKFDYKNMVVDEIMDHTDRMVKKIEARKKRERKKI